MLRCMVYAFFGLMLASPAARAGEGLFASSETYASSLQSFPKWTGVLRRQPGGIQKMEAQCASGKSCVKAKWDALVSELGDASTDEKIRRVNSFHNAYPYIVDIQNWGMNDYWEIVQEFLTKSGDCEDYAIAKYFTLKRLGFDDSDMRIVVLNDKNLVAMHSVLAVYRGDTIYILDNQLSSVVEHSKIHHYQPIYSINEHGWWRHAT